MQAARAMTRHVESENLSNNESRSRLSRSIHQSIDRPQPTSILRLEAQRREEKRRDASIDRIASHINRARRRVCRPGRARGARGDRAAFRRRRRLRRARSPGWRRWRHVARAIMMTSRRRWPRGSTPHRAAWVVRAMESNNPRLSLHPPGQPVRTHCLSIYTIYL
jgi:hypothetical protein